MPRRKKATPGQDEPKVAAKVKEEPVSPPAPPAPKPEPKPLPEPAVEEVESTEDTLPSPVPPPTTGIDKEAIEALDVEPAKVFKRGGYVATEHGWRPVH